jgi:hypothetical protein
MTRKELKEIIRKTLKEITIDVPGDGKNLTPQQKQREINQAKQTTGKSETGTSTDPVDFV